MTSIVTPSKTLSQLAEEVLRRPIPTHFQYKSTRDLVARFLRLDGVKTRKSSSRNVVMHPEYIADFDDPCETGFGNVDYRTHFSAIYHLEVILQPGEWRTA